MIKDFFTTLMIIALSLFIIAAVPNDSDAAIYEDTLRLHILANSDSDEDQSLKLLIRDKVLGKYGEILKTGESVEGAISLSESLVGDIKADVDLWIAEEGYNYTADVKITEEWYDTREYEDFSLPCGYYQSMQITLGDAEGKNWWCVMYPPLCLDLATEDAPADDGIIDYTKEELTLIESKGYSIKFRLIEVVSKIAGHLTKNS